MIGERSSASGQAALIYLTQTSSEAQTIERALGTANARLNTPPDSLGMLPRKDARDIRRIILVA